MPEKFIFVTIDFFGGYDLYIIAIISPLEPERAAEARRAVVASIFKKHDAGVVWQDTIQKQHQK